jgi:hypothetical protein
VSIAWVFLFDSTDFVDDEDDEEEEEFENRIRVP